MLDAKQTDMARVGQEWQDRIERVLHAKLAGDTAQFEKDWAHVEACITEGAMQSKEAGL